MAPDTVNVQNALAIGSEQSRQFSASLCKDFHKTIKKKVKTIYFLKKAVIVKEMVIYDVETLFSSLLFVGQQRSIDIADVFPFELSPVPPAVIDKYGCLRKGDKPCSSSLSVSLSGLNVLHTWSWLMPASFASVPRRLANLLDYKKP